MDPKVTFCVWGVLAHRWGLVAPLFPASDHRLSSYPGFGENEKRLVTIPPLLKFTNWGARKCSWNVSL